MMKSCKYERGYMNRHGCCCENCREGIDATPEQYQRMELLGNMWKDNLMVVIKKHNYHAFLMCQKFFFEVKELPSLMIRSCDLVEKW